MKHTTTGQVGQIVFCARKTASASIARSWAIASQNPVFHTHDMCYFVVTDVKESAYFKFAKDKFPNQIFHVKDLNMEFFEFTISACDLENMFSYFTRFVVISTTRDPLSRRMSELFQALTIDQINAVMDAVGIDHVLDASKKPCVSEICVAYELLRGKVSCPILLDALKIVHQNRRLLNYAQVKNLFEKHFVTADIREYTHLFQTMERHFDIDFDLGKVNLNGYDQCESLFVGKPVVQSLVKMETMESSKILKSLTGVECFRRDHDARDCHHLFQAPLETMKHYIRSTFQDQQLSLPETVENKIVRVLGYA